MDIFWTDTIEILFYALLMFSTCYTMYLSILCSGQILSFIIVHYHNQKNRLPILTNDVCFLVGIVKMCCVRVQGI